MTAETRLLRIVVADDSALVRHLYRVILDAEPDMVIVEATGDGGRCVSAVRSHRPDLVLLDLVMPGVDGIQAAREIMASAPTPIVLVTTRPLGPGSEAIFEALQAGAVEVIVKPDIHSLLREDARRPFLRALRTAADVKVVRRRIRSELPTDRGVLAAPLAPAAPMSARIVAIGASTGGPPCLRETLGAIDPAIAPPILVVQHMGADFVGGFARWLAASTRLSVEVASHGTLALPGHVYVAPGDRHLTLIDGGRTLSLGDGPEVRHQKPSIDVLFESCATLGQGAVGVLLTGMGDDGARGLLAMREASAFTMAQDEASAVAPSMPREAAKRRAACAVAAPREIAALLARLRHQPRTDT